MSFLRTASFITNRENMTMRKLIILASIIFATNANAQYMNEYERMNQRALDERQHDMERMQDRMQRNMDRMDYETQRENDRNRYYYGY